VRDDEVIELSRARGEVSAAALADDIQIPKAWWSSSHGTATLALVDAMRQRPEWQVDDGVGEKRKVGEVRKGDVLEVGGAGTRERRR